MAQHFLLSAAARTLSLGQIYKAGEEAAYETFKRLRWEDGEAVCPDCGCVECYEIVSAKATPPFACLLADGECRSELGLSQGCGACQKL